MAPAAYLQARPGERVLDLCAAPGGKTTQIAAQMRGEGLLVANEIHPARVRILSENVERMGVRNALVTNAAPADLRRHFGMFFHRIMVDAPCSGEGMFRKQETAADEWSLENVRTCAARQDEILEEAYAMLLPGGRMVYSTCTFAPDEDEGSISRFLAIHSDMHLVEVPKYEGMSRDGQTGTRILLSARARLHRIPRKYFRWQSIWSVRSVFGHIFYMEKDISWQ